jgi:AraC family transcriptional regulator
MKPRLEVLAEKKLIGKSLRMSLSNDRTLELWQSFMPSRKKIKNLLSTDLFSLQIYGSSIYFKDFNPETEFEKWAAAEVLDFNEIPDGMSQYILKGGLYAVFIHKGAANSFQKTFRYIFNSWLPDSEYELDNREHFEILGEKYKNNKPDSEEEVWIPVKQKK